MRLRDKVCVVTGAGSGFGRAIAVRFASEGARLALNDIDAKQLQVTAEATGTEEVVTRAGDCSSSAEAEALVGEAAGRWGRVDVLVNNAGIVIFRDPTDLTEEEWDRLLDTNLKSMWLWTRAALRYMLPQRGGSVINLSSMSAFCGQQFDGASTFAYNVTKAGALQLARSFATRYARDGIRFNAVCPGHFKTGLIRSLYPSEAVFEQVYAQLSNAIPLGRYGRPEELADLALFLASDESSYITGQGIIIDGGVLING